MAYLKLKLTSPLIDSDVIYYELFGTPFVVLNSHQAAVDLFEKRSAIYSDRPKRVMGQL